MPKRKMKVKLDQYGKARLNLRLPVELSAWMKTYAQEHHTTVTKIIIEHFTELKKTAEEGHVTQF